MIGSPNNKSVLEKVLGSQRLQDLLKKTGPDGAARLYTVVRVQIDLEAKTRPISRVL